MGAREDLLAAARSLRARGLEEFSPAQLIAAARAAGCAYPDVTLRTFIGGPMCANSPDHHAVQYGDLVRVGHGRYRLNDATSSHEPRLPAPHPSPNDQPARTEEREPTPSDGYWEGDVQAAVVAHLVSEGWRIRRVADTASREHGFDIDAERDEERLVVEVKGYPGSTYRSGARAGEAKSTPAAAQARAYFSHAVLTGLLARAEAPEVRVVLAFPEVTTYLNLAGRTAGPLAAAAIEVWLVSDDGRVRAVTAA